MIQWTKKAVTKDKVEPLCSKFNINQLLASIFLRRNITEGKDILYYLEDDLRFQHNPFLFSSMEDAVERILQAKEEGEKVLIFGDRDVDGVTSTAILYEYLVKIGIDTQWRLPVADEGYGLSMNAVDDFAAQNGSLIITVDCGISNFDEIDYANFLGMEVIITDHHNPPEKLPDAIIIIDPKTEDAQYPFKDISGAAVAYKLVSALRFSCSDFYNAEICIIDVNENDDKTFSIDCLKIRNLIKVKELHETIIPDKTSIYDLKLPYFLQGQLIYAWDAKYCNNILKNIFGKGIEFYIHDLRSEISNVIPSVADKTTTQLQSMSTIGRYIKEEATIINSIYNLYVTYCKKVISIKAPEDISDEKKDLQLVALAALADIMPMKNENRIFVNNGITSIKHDRPRPGLGELFNKLNINIEGFSSVDLSWTVIPALNAAGRMGKSNLSLQLLISREPHERERLANEIFDLNEERKNLVSKAIFTIQEDAEKSFDECDNKLCIVVNDCIHKGVTGIVAARLMQDLGVPALTVTYTEDICTGSMRSCRGLIATDFLDNFGDFFINHGGHNFAAGFSFKKEKIADFIEKTKAQLPSINLEEDSDIVEVDAEIPAPYIEPNVFHLLDIFEPYGSENSELLFVTTGIKLCDAVIVGKKEPQHLKLTFDTGKYKIPAMFWGQGAKLKNDIIVGKQYDILYNMSYNHFNGMKTNQFIIKDCVPHK